MTVAVTRTKAEQAYSGMFEAVAARLPGGRAVAEARKAAIGAFAGLGLPHRRIEEWKYTDLRAMLKEAFSPSLRRGAQVDERALEAAPRPGARKSRCRTPGFPRWRLRAGPIPPRCRAGQEAYRFDPLTRRSGPGLRLADRSRRRDRRPEGDAVVALNTAFMTDGALLRVVEGARLGRPIHLVFATTGAEKAAVTTRCFVEIGAGAEATVLESHVSLGEGAKQTNA